MTVLALTKSDQNKAAIDPWTVVHFGFGLAAGLMDIRFGPAMVAAAGWEVFEQGFEGTKMGRKTLKTSGPEKLGNVLIDLGIFAVGHELGRRWNKTR